MKLSNLGYLLKEGFRAIFLHGFMSFAAVCVTVACLLIVGSFSILMYNVNIMVEDLNQTNEVLAYVDSSFTEAEAKSIGTKINMIDNVLQADFISREEALKKFVADHQEDEAFSGVEAEDLRHRFRVMSADGGPVVEHQHGPVRECLWNIGDSGSVGGKMAGHPCQVYRQNLRCPELSCGHGQKQGNFHGQTPPPVV